MKTLQRILSIAICLFFVYLLNSCQPTGTDAQACIQTAATTYTTADTISFTSCSTDATTFFWHFGDGGTSNQENPTHNYTTAGTYTVTLVVGNSQDTGVSTTTITLQINGVPNQVTAADYTGLFSSKDSCQTGQYNPYNMQVTATGNKITFANFATSANVINLQADVNGYNFTIPAQTFNGNVVVSGSGNINAALNVITIYTNWSQNGATDQCKTVCTRI